MPFFEYNYKNYFSSLIYNIHCNINTLYFLAVHLSKAEFNIPLITWLNPNLLHHSMSNKLCFSLC